MQPPHLVERQVGAGRVVRVGEEHDLGTRGDALQDFADVGAQVRLRSDDGRRAVRQHDDLVEQEAVLGENRLVALAEIGVRQHGQQLVGAGPADDARRVEAVVGRNGIAQRRGIAVGVALQGAGALAEGGNRLRARPERRLVGRQLDRLHARRKGAFAGNIRIDIENARPGRGNGSGHEASSGLLGPGCPGAASDTDAAPGTQRIGRRCLPRPRQLTGSCTRHYLTAARGYRYSVLDVVVIWPAGLQPR